MAVGSFPTPESCAKTSVPEEAPPKEIRTENFDYIRRNDHFASHHTRQRKIGSLSWCQSTIRIKIPISERSQRETQQKLTLIARSSQKVLRWQESVVND